MYASGLSTLYNIGLYSSCIGKPNRTQENIEAEHIRNYYEKIIKERNQFYKISPEKLSYEAYDVCHNITYLAQIIEKLILTDQYYGVARMNFNDSSILTIFTQMPRDMTAFVKASVFDYISVIDGIDNEYLEDGSIYSPTKSFAHNLVQVAQYFGWVKLTLISFTTSSPLYLGYKKESVKMLRGVNICLELFHINPIKNTKEVPFLKSRLAQNETSPMVFFANGLKMVNFVEEVVSWRKEFPSVIIAHEFSTIWVYLKMGTFGQNPSVSLIVSSRNSKRSS